MSQDRCPYSYQRALYLRKRALYLCKRAPYFCKRAHSSNAWVTALPIPKTVTLICTPWLLLHAHLRTRRQFLWHATHVTSLPIPKTLTLTCTPSLPLHAHLRTRRPLLLQAHPYSYIYTLTLTCTPWYKSPVSPKKSLMGWLRSGASIKL